MATVLTRRHLLATAVLAWLALPAVASADVEWCFDDPPVLVRLPNGDPVNVNVRVLVPAGQRAQLRATLTSGTVVSAQSQNSIQLAVLVPSGPTGAFPVKVTVRAGKEHVAVNQSGMSGSPIIAVLPLPTA